MKKISVMALVGVLVLTGFGCKGLSSTDKTATSQMTLEYWTVFDDVGAIRELAAKYTAQRPYMQINVRQLRADEIYNRFVEELADDKGPDVISVNVRSLGKYQSRLQPMPAGVTDTLMTITQNQFGGENVVVNRVPRTMVTLNQLRTDFIQTISNDVVRDGKIYGLPISFDVMGIYYNKDLLDRAGIPEPPKTWEEFQGQVKTLTKYDKTTGKILQSGAALGTGSNIPSSSDLLYVLYAQSKLPFIAKNGQVMFNRNPDNYGGNQISPGAQVLDFYTDFANPTKDTYTWNAEMPNALESFANGQTAFYFGYSYQYAAIKSRAPQLNFDVIPLLQLMPETPVNVANYSVQAVPQKSKRSSEAWAFIDYLARSPANKEYLDKTKRLSALRSYIAEQKKMPEIASFTEQLLVADNWYRGKDFEAADKAIQDIFEKWTKQPPEPDMDVNEWKKQVINDAASKVAQTMVDQKK